MSYINKENLLEQFNSLEQLARKRVYDTPTNSPAYERYSTQYYEREKALSIIKAQPTADVVEVRHGEWIDKHCSICGETQPYTARGNAFATTFYQFKTKFCPECGAKMDGERREG